MRYRGEVWQGGMRVAMVEARSIRGVRAELAHYAMMYGQDGIVKLKLVRERVKRKLRRRIK